MSEMIERVARALCILDGRNPDEIQNVSINFQGDEAPITWKLYVKKAQTAIEAMMEPTEEMINANPYGFYVEKALGYTSMIKAALK